MCAVREEDLQEFLNDESWGNELELRIKLDEIRGHQVRISIQAPRKVAVMRAEIEPFLAEWKPGDGISTQVEMSEEILFAFKRKTLRREVKFLESGDPLDLLEIKVEGIEQDFVKIRFGLDIRNLRFSRHAETPEGDELI